MSDKSREEKRDSKTDYIAVAALALAVLSLLISFITLYQTFFNPGDLVIHEPIGFCIVRGYQDMGFKSDHLVIPIVIENTGKGTKIFQQPTLSLQEKNSGQKLNYRMTGFIPDIYRTTLDKAYEIGFGRHIPENSVGQYVLVFHIENWWDTSKPEFSEFNFKAGQEWEISMDYFYDGEAKTWHSGGNKVFLRMPVYSTIDKLKYGGDYNSDCFSLK